MENNKNMIKKQWNTENPELHWEFIECNNEIVADLGCGRWEHVEYRDKSWLTTPEFLIKRGAKKVYAFDIDNNEVEWYQSHVANKMQVEPINLNINSVEHIREIYNKCNPTVIKSDIETYEKYFLDLNDDEFRSIKFYAIETHTVELLNQFINKFNELNYEIIAELNYHISENVNVLFAKRK